MLTLCDRVLCNLGGKLRMKSMEGERARQLKASSTYLEILLREDAKAYAKSRYYLRRESFRVPNILIILDAEAWDYFQYVGFVILYHPITSSYLEETGSLNEDFLGGFAGGFYKVSPHDPGWQAFTDLVEYVNQVCHKG